MEVGLVLLLDVAVCVCWGGGGRSSSLKTLAPVLLLCHKEVSDKCIFISKRREGLAIK